VVATDVSEDALSVARSNAERHGLADRVTFCQGFWFEALAEGTVFDAILSNPPYVAATDLAQAMPEVRDHEPRIALDGGDDGLDAYRLLVSRAAAWLKPDAWLIVEVGQGQSEAVLAMASESGRYGATQVEPDYQGIPRVVSLQRSA
jgi:release factor glutamine methyltransferase